VVQRMRMKYPDLQGMPALQLSAVRLYPPVAPGVDAGTPPGAAEDADAGR
jgi:hypothetical protein